MRSSGGHFLAGRLVGGDAVWACGEEHAQVRAVIPHLDATPRVHPPQSIVTPVPRRMTDVMDIAFP